MDDSTQQLEKPNFGPIKSLTNLETRVRYEIAGDIVKIGRHPDNQIVLDQDVYVSTYHAEIFYKDGYYWLQDANSRNGTLKNNSVLTEPVPLEPGDVVTIGRTRFEVR